MRLIRDGEKGGGGGGGGVAGKPGGMGGERERERDYIPIATLPSPELFVH